MAKKPVNWKKILQAGAIATDAFSKGSAGGIGKTLAEQKDLDLSGMFFNEQDTNNAAGQDTKEWKNRVKGT